MPSSTPRCRFRDRSLLTPASLSAPEGRPESLGNRLLDARPLIGSGRAVRQSWGPGTGMGWNSASGRKAPRCTGGSESVDPSASSRARGPGGSNAIVRKHAEHRRNPKKRRFAHGHHCRPKFKRSERPSPTIRARCGWPCRHPPPCRTQCALRSSSRPRRPKARASSAPSHPRLA